MVEAVSKRKKIVRVLFDEAHSESWSVSEEKAREMQPENPTNSSYQIAANALRERDFEVQRNLDQPLHRNLLSKTDILALIHPCDSKWERTTCKQSPQLSPQEIKDIHEFVKNGGGLLVVAEYEHDKYGDNLNDLLAEFGMQIENSTIFDRSSCLHENPNYCFIESSDTSHPLAHLSQKICVYLAGSCNVSKNARIAWRTSEHATPKLAGIVAEASYGKGRVILVTDSNLFGDEHIRDFHHMQLWINLVHWCAAPAFSRSEAIQTPSTFQKSSTWTSLKETINKLRLLQKSDGSIDPQNHSQITQHIQAVTQIIQDSISHFPHQSNYLNQVLADLKTWSDGGFQKPDFGKSLLLFDPVNQRRDQIEHLIIFPLYTPNASLDTRFEALLIRVPWPDWLAELERNPYQNKKFVPGHLIDFTDGYKSECAVLFPETISLSERPTNNFAMIFCDREARRLQSYTLKASSIVQLPIHPQLECFLNSLSTIQDTTALWDLIHDRSHSHGELPFDPFMIRQRSPYWMYAIEELRVDLESFCEATRLAQNGFPFAHHVTYAVLFDRIFRFPITGTRVRNYDALGGQILFCFLHQKDVLIWSDNQLQIHWDKLSEAVHQLREEVTALYREGTDCSKISFWIAAHDFVSKYVKPSVASRWKKDSRVIDNEADLKKWVDLVLDDEFPLGNFHTHLLKKMAGK